MILLQVRAAPGCLRASGHLRSEDDPRSCDDAVRGRLQLVASRDAASDHEKGRKQIHRKSQLDDGDSQEHLIPPVRCVSGF